MIRNIVFTALCTFAIAGCEATGWYAENDLAVVAMPDGAFQVTGKPHSSPADYWCAAGDYAIRVLGVMSTQRIYVVKGLAKSSTTGRKVVNFSLTEPETRVVKRSLLLSVDRVGENLGVSFASNYCWDRKFLDV